ncbi:ribonuclease III domain-containing protein [Calycina marina]|uniref:Ribonuclease III domain-containing protein n=1 Tax=Calycina marina TaxID=1763456 RepID=A0A9P7Z610_9HELO|nr:ribonuclease III domain-containing protein [Calycina marina]
MSLMVLATFVDSLAQGVDSTACAEYIIAVQNKEYICEVILPEKSPIRGALGRPHTTKAVAKCSAAFNACVALRQGKYLDQNLRPTFTKQLPAMRNALLAVDSKKREAFDMRTKPNMWSVDVIPEEVYVTIFSLDKPECLDRPSQPLAILTRKDLPQLPSFPLHFGAGKYSVVQITTLARPFKIDAARLELANAFTLLIFNDVFSKEYESDMAKMPYFIVPVEPGEKPDQNSDPGNVIAWETLIEVMKRQQDWGNQRWENKIWKNQPDSFFEDKFLVDPYDGSRKLWTVGVDHGKTPLEPVPPGSAPRKGNRRNNDNILEYSCSLWAAARSRRSFNEVQPVVKAKLIPLRRNLLDEFDIQKSECDQSYVIIEPLRVSPLPTAIVAMAYTFPAVIHRLESYLIALDGCAVLKLDIKPDLALEAFTKDFEDFEEHGQEQVTFQRGMGRNYERLEFYGDAFLKMATSISLYGTLPENNEYAYHVDRMLLICNKNLRNNSVDLKLYEYIRSKGFSRRAWYPAGIVLKKGKKTTDSGLHSHRLGDKTIADVSEAIIGAALLSTNTMDNAVRAVTELVASKNHEARSYSDYYKLYKKPVYQTAPATEAHKWLAQEVEKKHSYHFNYPRLLRSAFLHPSYPFAYEKIPSYQRLEFLGDALYDMVCIDFLFHSFPDKDPQWLTEHKMAMVSNQFLGALCVHLNFQTHILNFNSTYQAQITNYVTDIKEARRQAEEEAVRAGKLITDCLPDYWTSIKQPPKCLPDMVEAFIGALFVDSEYDYSQVQRFFDEHVKWYFRDMSVYDSFANKHPTTFLTKFLQVQMGCMDWNMHCQEKKSIDGSKPEVVCVVMIHSKVVSDHTAESTRYAKVNAAKKAVELLKGLPLPEFREKYNCDCREDIEATKAGARHVY